MSTNVRIVLLENQRASHDLTWDLSRVKRPFRRIDCMVIGAKQTRFWDNSYDVSLNSRPKRASVDACLNVHGHGIRGLFLHSCKNHFGSIKSLMRDIRFIIQISGWVQDILSNFSQIGHFTWT